MKKFLSIIAFVGFCFIGTFSLTQKVDANSVGWVGYTQSTSVMRFYNPNTGKHDFSQEGVGLPSGFYSEGIAFKTVSKYDNNTNAMEIYKLTLNSDTLLIPANQSSYISSLQNQGWRNEGIAFKAFLNPNGILNQRDGCVPVYRLIYTGSRFHNSHHYTKDQNEVNYLTRNGWQIEGIQFYAFRY